MGCGASQPVDHAKTAGAPPPKAALKGGSAAAATAKPDSKPAGGEASRASGKLSIAPSGGRRKTTTTRRVAVSAETENNTEDASDYVAPVIDKPPDVKTQIKKGLTNNPLFESLEAALLDVIVDAVSAKEFEAGAVVIQQGDPGDNFYVVASGELEAFLKVTGDEPIQEYRPGDSFGELALMYNRRAAAATHHPPPTTHHQRCCRPAPLPRPPLAPTPGARRVPDAACPRPCRRSPRAATVRCKTAASLYALDRLGFRALVTKHNKENKHGLNKVLSTVPMISDFEPEQIQALADAVDMQSYDEGEYIVSMGEAADSLYIILSGEVTCHQGAGTAELMRQSVGSFFGESALNVGVAERQANVVAVGKVRCACLKATTFQQLFGEAREVIRRNFNRKVLSGVPLIKDSGLGPSDLEQVCMAIREEVFQPGETVLEQGVPGQTFYIIKSGAVECLKDGDKLAELGRLDYFGERSLLTAEVTAAKVVASGAEPAVLMSLGKATFEAQLGPLKDLLEAEAAKRERVARARSPATRVQWADLEIHAVLGEGSFGRVKLARHTPTRAVYALKCLRKGQLLKLQQVEHVVNEKRVMEMCDHPFVLKMVATFNAKDEIFMLLEVAQGGELFTLLRSAGKFDEGHACLYAAMVAAAFAYLHARKIAHRDLKPENLLFDGHGYLKLVDFGFAKVVRDRTWTLCGTPEYLAPEIISNKGHSVGADWWTMGILLYEMLVGHPPFVAESQMDTYHKIMRGKYKIPQNFPRGARDMISKLLTYNPAGRLGCWKNGAKDVLNHEFFRTIDWQKLVNRELRVPHTPMINDPLDTSNFDQYPMEDNSSWDKYNDPAYESIWVKEFGG